MGSIVFGQHAGVGVRVVAADNHHCLDVELADDLQSFFKLLFLFQLGSARPNHVEAACVAILVNEFGG